MQVDSPTVPLFKTSDRSVEYADLSLSLYGSAFIRQILVRSEIFGNNSSLIVEPLFFEHLLHTSLQTLFGIVGGGVVTIDLLTFQNSSIPVLATARIPCVYLEKACQAFAMASSYQGYRCRLSVLSISPVPGDNHKDIKV